MFCLLDLDYQTSAGLNEVFVENFIDKNSVNPADTSVDVNLLESVLMAEHPSV